MPLYRRFESTGVLRRADLYIVTDIWKVVVPSCSGSSYPVAGLLEIDVGKYLLLLLLLIAIGQTPVDSSTVHIYTQTVHTIHRTEHT
jgi:hypothetical protein